MEDIQKKHNEYLVLDDFNKLPFTQGDMPNLILDLIDYMTGAKGLFHKVLTQNLTPAINTLTR